MNDQNTNDQGAANEAELEKELEALIDGNAAPCGAATSEDQEPTDLDESDESGSDESSDDVPSTDETPAETDPCADQGGCGGGCAG